MNKKEVSKKTTPTSVSKMIIMCIEDPEKKVFEEKTKTTKSVSLLTKQFIENSEEKVKKRN